MIADTDTIAIRAINATLTTEVPLVTVPVLPLIPFDNPGMLFFSAISSIFRIKLLPFLPDIL